MTNNGFDNVMYENLKKLYEDFLELAEKTRYECEGIHDMLMGYADQLKGWLDDMRDFERTNDCSLHREEISKMKKVIDEGITNIKSGMR